MTPAQYASLKAAILSDGNITALVQEGATGQISTYLNGASTFVVWKSASSTADIGDAITWANLTPTDSPDGTQTWLNRTMSCQSKQLNLQIILQGKDSINSAKSSIRSGLQDALTNVPSGVAGALQSAGWLTVKAAMYRFASIVEKIFANGTGTSGAPGNLVFEGAVSGDDVVQALFNS